MAAPPPPPKGGGMSLYANLLNPKADSSTSISGAPVLYGNNDKEDPASKKEANPALRFQPIRRPQANQKKVTKPVFPKTIASASTATTSENRDAAATTARADTPPDNTKPPAGAVPRSTLADWAGGDDDDAYLWGGAGAGEKRQRGGRKAAKKRRREQEQRQRAGQQTDWDEIYDPSRPTNVDEYLRSDERVREVQEWKAVLYAHRRRDRLAGRRGSGSSYGESDEDSEAEQRPAMGNQFAPPQSYSFAPPPLSPSAQPARGSPAAAPVPDDATGDDAYARRLALSGMGTPAVPPSADTPTPPPPPPPPPPSAPPAPPEDGATISRAPVRYEAPPPPPPPPDAMDIDQAGDEDDDDYDVENISLPAAPGLGTTSSDDAGAEADQPRSSRPGQAGFAQRLMSKYGWTSGSGLGAGSTGIISPLAVKVEKRKRKEGGGFAEPGGRGKIIGGKTAPRTDLDGETSGGAGGGSKFGVMSEVVVLRGMLEGMEDTLQEEISQGLGQEIGEECGDKYGRVERLHIDVEGRQVFIRFTDQVSALRAVNALEGRVFNGNAIAARFWDAERFERGEYS